MFVFGVSDVRERQKRERWRRCSCKLTGLPRRPRPRLRHRRRGPSSTPAASYAFDPLPPSPDRPFLIDCQMRNDRLESIARSPAAGALWMASNSGENGWRQREPSQGGARRSPAKGFDLRRTRCKTKSRRRLRTPVALRRGEKTTTQQRRDALRTQRRRESGRVSLGGVDRDAALRLPLGGAGWGCLRSHRVSG